MMQDMHLQYSAAPQPTHQDYGGCVYYGGQNKYQGQGGSGAEHQVNWIGGRGGCGSSDLTHYCWTHVMCAHSGTEFRTLV